MTDNFLPTIFVILIPFTEICTAGHQPQSCCPQGFRPVSVLILCYIQHNDPSISLSSLTPIPTTY
jgi:hypothetical protein